MKTKSSSKTKGASATIATASKKRATTKRVAAKAQATSGIQKLLSDATPYALPGAGALATAALAAAGFVLRKDIASFARDKGGSGIEEVLRMLHLERRSMHAFGAAGIFAGGLAMGCLAGFFLVPRILASRAAQTDVPMTNLKSDHTDGVSLGRSPTNAVAQRSS